MWPRILTVNVIQLLTLCDWEFLNVNVMQLLTCNWEF
jgi:hypothetical protein